MRIQVRIDTSNAAFTECDDPTLETARIMRDLAKRIEGHPHFGPGFSLPLRDVNGNEVGYMSVHK